MIDYSPDDAEVREESLDPPSALQTYLRSLRACDAAITWAAGYDDLPSAWAACERGDWMLWLLATGRLADDRTLRRLACRMVRETPVYDADGHPDGRTVWDLLTDERSRVAVETAERWCDGRATDEELRAAGAAAGAAAWAAEAAAGDAARAAAWAAAWAAARTAAGTAARTAAHAAWDAADAAMDAAMDAARAAQAAIIRTAIPTLTIPTTEAV
jgi:hypothetical protein